MMTFKEYVATLNPAEAKTSDIEFFLTEAQADQRLPDARTVGELTAYLFYRRRADFDVLDAAEAVWADYATATEVALSNPDHA